MLQWRDKFFFQESTTKTRIDVRRTDGGTSIFQSVIKESYNKLGVKGRYTNKLPIANLYTKLLKIRNSLLTS